VTTPTFSIEVITLPVSDVDRALRFDVDQAGFTLDVDYWETPEAEVDPRVGGKVRVVMRRPDGKEIGAQGEYTLIDRPHRLVMTWTFSDDPANEQVIELTFAEPEGSTTVLLVNSGISTDERRDAQDQGWHGCLDQLEPVLAG
jgi:uncharacterized protein YndB with AHSA1/START domain